MSGNREYRAAAHLHQNYEPSACMVTTVRVHSGPSHDRVMVWCRGGYAGTLTVAAGDGETVAYRLLNREVAP